MFFPGLFFTLWSNAQVTQPAFEQLTDQGKLPVNEIYSITQDQRGYIWMGTVEGLVRYDGYEFKKYRAKGQVGRSITNLQQGPDGTVFMQNFFSQILFIEGDSLHVFEPWEDFRKNGVFFYQMLRHGDSLVVRSSTVIHRFKIGAGGSLPTEEPINSLQSLAIEKDFEGNLRYFVYTENSEIQIVKDQISIGELPGMYVIMPFSKGHILFPHSSEKQDVYIVHPDGQKTSIPAFLQKKVNGFVQTTVDSGWVLTTEGAYEITWGDMGITISDVYFADHSITDLLIDFEGNYWFTSNTSGLFFVKNRMISVFPKDFSSNVPMSIAVSEGDTLVVGFSNCSMMKIGRDGEKVTLPPIPNEGVVQSVFYDANDQQVYLSCGGCFAYEDSKFRSLESIGNVKKLQSFGVDTLLFTEGHRLMLLRKSEDQYAEYKPIEQQQFGVPFSETFHAYSLSGKRIVTSLVTSRKHVLVGFYDQLIMADQDGYREILLEGEPIFAIDIVEGSNGELWIATSGQGLLKVRDGAVEVVYNAANSKLASNHIRKLLYENETLWVATSLGLVRVSLKSNYWEVIDEVNGLTPGKILDMALTDQYLYLIISGTLLRLEKYWTSRNNYRPPIYLENVKIGGQSVDWKRPLTLHHDENELEISFIGLSFRSRRNFSYQYRMLGLDEQWKTVAANSSIARYASLAPGDYQFEVKAINEHGVDSVQPASFTFQIRKPFWNEWWFYVAVAVLLLGMITLVVNGRFRAINRRMRLEYAQQELKQRLLRVQMNPHFIFNSLGAIQQFLFAHRPHETGAYMAMFAKLMRQVLEFSTVEYISLDDEIATLQNYIELQQLRFVDQFDYQVNVAEEIDTEEVRIPPMFAQPIIENAIEHGIAKSNHKCQLTISYQLEGNMIRLTVSDDGAGIAAQKHHIEHRSHAIRIIRERIELINRQRGTGNASFVINEREKGVTAVFLLPVD